MEKKTEKNIINEGTVVSLFAVICCVPALIYASFWLYSVRSDASDGAEAKKLYYKIDKRLDRIENKLGTKPTGPEKEDNGND